MKWVLKSPTIIVLFPVILHLHFLYPACGIFPKNLISWSKRTCCRICNGIVSLIRAVPFFLLTVEHLAPTSSVFSGKPVSILGSGGKVRSSWYEKELTSEVGRWVRDTHFLLADIKQSTLYIRSPSDPRKKRYTIINYRKPASPYFLKSISHGQTLSLNSISLAFFPPCPHAPLSSSLFLYLLAVRHIQNKTSFTSIRLVQSTL